MSQGVVNCCTMDVYQKTTIKWTNIQKKYLALLSSNYLENYHDAVQNKSDHEKIYDKLLLAADYVAGMTDGYARLLYRELKGM